MYFTASTAAHGLEIWRSDGTPGGTRLLRETVPGPASDGVGLLTASAGRLFFAAGHNSKLWISDGTSAGTQLLPGPFEQVGQLAAIQSGVVSVSNEPATGYELRYTHATTRQTRTLDLSPGPSSSYPQILGVVQGSVYFVGSDSNNQGLWRTDFSANGTVFLGSALATAKSFAVVKTSATTSVVFVGTDTKEIWRTNGTVASTVRVARYTTETTVYPRLFGVGPRLFISLRLGGQYANESRLLTLDPRTNASLELLKPRAPILDIHDLAGRAIFTADHRSGQEPWVSDGTVAGTKQLRDIAPGSEHSMAGKYAFFGGSSLGPGFVFRAQQAGTGFELWFTNGTTAGTRLLVDLRRGASGSFPDQCWSDPVTHDVWFRADDGVRGVEPWQLSSTGTRLVADLNPRPPGSRPSRPNWGTAIPAGVVFAADDGVHGNEPWITDGTAAGTRLILDVTPGAAGAELRSFHALGNGAVFEVGRELWFTDGSAVGTRRLQTFPGSANSPPLLDPFCVARGTGYFIAPESTGGYSLWRTDGTPQGARRAIPQAPASSATELCSVGDVVYLGTDGQLWRSDGSASGTRKLLQFPLPVGPFTLTRLGSSVLFRGLNRHFSVPWVCDGTIAGSKQLSGSAIMRGEDGPFVEVRGQALFAAHAALWRTDGTPAGTIRLAEALGPREITSITTAQGERALFVGASPGQQRELWITDGTAAGTRQLIDLYGTHSANPIVLAATERTVWFTARSPRYEDTLWQTDGTAGGTRQIPGVTRLSGVKAQFVRGRLLFTVIDAQLGLEPWVLDVGATSEAVGSGCGIGSKTPRMSPVDPILGQTVSARGDGLAAGSVGALLVGAGPYARLGDCWLETGAGPLLNLGPVRVQGEQWSLGFGVPNDARLRGVPFVAQGVFLQRTSGTVGWSNGVRMATGR